MLKSKSVEINPFFLNASWRKKQEVVNVAVITLSDGRRVVGKVLPTEANLNTELQEFQSFLAWGAKDPPTAS